MSNPIRVEWENAPFRRNEAEGFGKSLSLKVIRLGTIQRKKVSKRLSKRKK
jgi:hypothetical protein